MNDNRLGKWENGSPQYPVRTISGREYTKPCTTQDIGDGLFVVVDMRPSVDVDAEIKTILAALKPRKAKAQPIEEKEGGSVEPQTDSP